ncbi:hypothetical protein Daesc_001733 [Daldinia eschscholtzii]|uniref:Outer spore wall protein RRT8 n=1 Tax=Daldinia eschscholtzii TaxID=292717 RepID=A0AAX6MV13_9PEZI
MSSSFASNVQTKAQEVAKEDYEKARVLLSEAAKSGSYLYPFKGIVYFITHRSLWKPFYSRILPTLGLTAGVTASMFFFTYLPQLAILVFVNGPLAVFTTVLLILNESSTIVNLISRNFLLQDALLDTFDGTLVAKDAVGIVSEGRQLKSGQDPIGRLGKILKNPFSKFTPKALVRYIMYLPLNFIPGVFPVVGREVTLFMAGFGTIATLLEMIPVASMFFAFTNTVGAALWAADIEQRNTQMTQGTAPQLRESAKKAE